MIKLAEDGSLIWYDSYEELSEAEIVNGRHLNCDLFLDVASYYMKEKIIEDGIPFVLKGKQVYLPFIGYMLSNANERSLALKDM